MKWNATLPKGKPPEGKADVVFSFKDENGARQEICGRVSVDVAGSAFIEILESLNCSSTHRAERAEV